MDKIKKYKNYFIFSLLFFIICLCIFKPFIDNKRTLVWNIDSAGQYYPVFIYIGQWLRQFFLNILSLSFDFTFFDL